MGYNTEFIGSLHFNKPLSLKEKEHFDTFKNDMNNKNSSKYTKEDICFFEFDISNDNSYIYWDNTEKPYDISAKLKLFIKFMLENNSDFELNGELLAQGENIEDRYKIIVNKNTITEEFVEDNHLELKLYPDREEIWVNGSLVKESERLSFFDLEEFKYVSSIKVNSYD